MGHDHHHSHNNNKKVLLFNFLFITFYMIIEFIGGLITNSLALLADAGHMLSDAVALGLSLLAFHFGEKPATKEKTYGFKRFEILAALINGFTLIGISLYIFWEAFNRFREPPEIMGLGMFLVAVIGLIVNIIVAWIIAKKGDTKENLNMRSAFLHVMSDMLGSIGAIVAALLIMGFGWSIADPIISVVVSILIIISGWRITKDSLHVLMEGTPKNIEINKVKEKLLSIPEVKGIHDLHVWTITSGFPALSGHLTVKNNSNHEVILREAAKILKEGFHIEHTTIQLEEEDYTLVEEENHWDWERT